MPDNQRVYYAIQQLGFATAAAPTTFTAAHGVQSIGITTTFNLEQVFEMGQIAIYENIEQIPDVQVTCEKVLDGYPLLYHLATMGAPENTLPGRSNQKAVVAVAIFSDTLVSASGSAKAEVHMKDMVTSSLGYTIAVGSSATESLTLVGNSKIWKDVEGGDAAVFTGAFTTNLDQPASLADSGGVQRQEDVLFTPGTGAPTGLDENGMSVADITVLPTDIYGMTSSGINPTNADGSYVVPIQSISVSADLGRDQIFELGRKSPYFRYVTFPVEVRCEIETLSRKFDNISATEAGGENLAPPGSNLRSQTIRVQMREGTKIDLGTRNKLQSVTESGGDAGGGGGNVTLRYSYVTYNTLDVTHPADPTTFA